MLMVLLRETEEDDTFRSVKWEKSDRTRNIPSVCAVMCYNSEVSGYEVHITHGGVVMFLRRLHTGYVTASSHKGHSIKRPEFQLRV